MLEQNAGAEDESTVFNLLDEKERKRYEITISVKLEDFPYFIDPI